ncbi:hypothetical protein AKJ49_01425 [candidate division MSBL1 archaeon SCGC-AAA382A03]|uniref:Uncharacterized protein n=1 Tax=candidate division MSBL1 archaeon SCGC-AAA382A03 TaxID=1698278 RepID=A0A133VF87_9EURY|nr:hypothetical protein AKJ49_01425 [candidate division MSBL1 archaeon SCGC-AAA382A03]
MWKFTPGSPRSTRSSHRPTSRPSLPQAPKRHLSKGLEIPHVMNLPLSLRGTLQEEQEKSPDFQDEG